MPQKGACFCVSYVTTYHAEAHLASILEELELADSNFDTTKDDHAAAEAKGIAICIMKV